MTPGEMVNASAIRASGLPRLALVAGDDARLAGPHAAMIEESGVDAGFEVVSLGRHSPRTAWLPVIDLVIALDAASVLATKRRVGMSNPRMALILACDGEPDDVTHRVVRVADLLVVSQQRQPAFHGLDLRPEIIDPPADQRQWRHAFDRALVHAAGR